MIITLNTKEDSKEEIKKVIQMLMKLIDEMPSSANFEPIASEGIFGLFDNPSKTQSTLTDNPSPENKEPDDRIEIYDY
jgi:hypothetical protein